MAERIAGKHMVVTNIFDRGIMMVLSFLLTPSKEAYIRVLWNHYANFPVFFLFSIIRLFWNIIHFGLYCRLMKRIRPIRSRRYDDSARIETVVWTCKPTPIDESRMQYYMTAHQGFAHPKIVLSDNFMLARVLWSENEAVFVDFGKPVQDNYTVRKATFLWDELIFDAQRVVKMPIESFFRLAEEEINESDKIDNHCDDLSILFGTGRCGSTLLAKIIDQADPDCLVLSEPMPFCDLYKAHKRVAPAHFRRLTLNTLRLLCKPHSGKTRFFFKPLCITMPIGREIHRLLPKTRLLYCYRDPLKTAWAHERAFGVTLAYQGYSWCHWFHLLKVFESISGCHPNYRMDEISYRKMPRSSAWEVCFMMWAAHHLTYREQTREFEFPKICYDDVFKDPVKFCCQILAMSGYDLPRHPDLLDRAMRALNEDSQEGRSISQRQLQGYPSTKMTPELWERITGLSKELDLPLPAHYQESKKQSDKVFMPPEKPSTTSLATKSAFQLKNGYRMNGT